MDYQKKLQNPLWQRKRLEVFNRDNFCCHLCKDDQTELHVHHLKYTGEPWEAPLKDLQTLCANCHHIVTESEKTTNLNCVSIKRFENGIRVSHRKDGIADIWYSDHGMPVWIMCYKNDSEVIKYIFKNLKKKSKAK